MYLYLAGTLTYYYKKGQKVESGREILEAEVDKFIKFLNGGHWRLYIL